MTVAPYGSWESPLTAAHVAAGSEPVYSARFVRGAIWYTARINDEGGRTGIFVNRSGRLGESEQVLPAGFNARSRVHEYGGGAWEVDPDSGTVVFVNAADQRLYAFDPDTNAAAPRPLTPHTDSRVRYGDLVRSGGRLLGVREHHGQDGAISRAVVAIDGTRISVLSDGPHFVAWPRISPRGDHLSYIGWEHPHMPWDETRVYIQALVDGVPSGPPVAIFGRPGESVLQPEWLSGTTLAVTADRSGTWQPYRLDVPAFLARERGEVGTRPAEEVQLGAIPGEIGGPLWTLGAHWHLPVQSGNRLLVESRQGSSSLIWADTRTGEHRRLDCELSSFEIQDFHNGTALLIGGSAHRVSGLYLSDVASGRLTPVALANEKLDHAAFYPTAEERDFHGVPAIVYPPHNPNFTAPADEKPPYVAFVHGGPTGQAVPMASAHHAFFTSRGIGVIDVNYGGSTGYGRAYRDRLKGQWGIVDVEDTVAALTGLVAEGAADEDRLAISGGSAGGWTVLRALTTTDRFACGTSYYGVAELTNFITETHDFESRYIESLVGPWPEAAELYEERAPLNHLDSLRVPVAIFQGEIDPIVPKSQAKRLINVLEEQSLPYAATFYPGESHGFVRVENIIDSLETELGFYGRIMGFRTPGIAPVVLRGRGR
jgi:dipeptidyl aminopeptidase/acylaminoacyl peptidase